MEHGNRWSEFPVRVLICVVLALTCVGTVSCDAIKPPDKTAENRAKQSSPYKIVRDFKELVAAARANDRKKILRTIETYLLTAPEFDLLFGEKLGRTLWSKYRDVIAAKLRKEIVDVLISRVKAGFDQIDIIQVSTVRPKDTTRGDLAIINAMKHRPTMFSIRLRKKNEALGLRFNGFIHVKGRWRSLFKAYDFLPKEPPVPVGKPG